MNYRNFKKKKNKKFILGIAAMVTMLALVLSVFFVSKAFEDNKGYRTISVVETAGTVTVVKDGIDYKAYPGMLLQEGHILVTAGDGTVRLVLDGDKYVKVESGSRVVFETLGFWGSEKTSINLERGALTAELVNPLEENQEFVINTPNAVLAVRGTFFRVDLKMSEKGEIRANVMTYGGQVATRRIFPTGEVEEEEVLVSSGFKTAIHMDDVNTVYVAGKMAGAMDTTGDKPTDIAPIQAEDISDDDLVDIYYSAQNGHTLFMTAQEAKAGIEDRNIDLENTVSVYQTATELLTTTEASDSISDGTRVGLNIVIDDGEPLAMVTDTINTTAEYQTGFLTDGESTIENTENISAENTQNESDNSQNTDSENDNVGNTDTESNTTENIGNESNVTDNTDADNDIVENDEAESNVPENDTTGSTGENTTGGAGGNTTGGTTTGGTGGNPTAHTHTEQETRTEPTCSESGMITISCTGCGEVLSETEIPATGHTPKDGGTLDAHSICDTCDTVLNTTHVYTQEVTQEATCTQEGTRLYLCDCGYSYEVPFDATGHNPVYGNDANVHSKCGTCGEILEDGSYHVLTELNRTESTCTTPGQVNKECNCGYSTQESLPLAEHQYHHYAYDTDICSTCGLPMVELSLTNFPDSKFLAYVTQFDTDGNGYLYNTEMTSVTSIDISGDTNTDGGYTSLTGIEYFTQLTDFDCSYNSGLTALDFQKNTNIETLTLTGCFGVTSLVLYNAKLQELNLNNFSNLQSLDIQMCYNLETIYAQNCTNLTSVVAYRCTALNSADFTGNANLQTADFSGNKMMTTLYLDNCTGLTMVTVSNCGSSSGGCTIYMRGTGFDSNILNDYNSNDMTLVTE